MTESFPDVATNESQFQKVRKNKVRDNLDKTNLKIGGKLYRLGFIGRIIERFQVAAQTDFFNNTIVFDVNQTESELLASLLHEIIEVINRKNLLNLDHHTICNLENALFDVLVDNPVFLGELLRYARSLKKG